MNHQTRFEHLGTVPPLNLRAINTESWPFAVKHALDRITAGLLLVARAPLLAVMAIAVRVSSPGPILFRQPRAGRDGSVFDLLKFRTMRGAAADDARTELPPGITPSGVGDLDRRTRIGQLLRSVSLDELPQLSTSYAGR